ncbi:MAG: hypothetical protein RR939_08915 [Acinetobacter sp.]
MNMMTKPELFCPQFPLLDLSSEMEVTGSKVSFDLTYGCNTLNCEIQADSIDQVREVTPQFNPEFAYDQEYEQLVVDSRTYAVVVNTDGIEAPVGLRITLTEKQVIELNKQLEYLADELADESLGIMAA